MNPNAAPLLEVRDLKVYFPIEKGIIVRRRTSFWRNASRLFGRDAANG